MYYLNDKHPQYEYCLYVRNCSACPYIARTFTDIYDVYRFVEEIEKKHNRYNRVFYIDNDFYQNKYSPNVEGIYYKFLKRRINDWEEVA